MQDIISYITEKYNPVCIILYGSYANATNNSLSDFDCMIVTENKTIAHDTSFVGGIQLDLFIYSPDEIASIDCIPLFDAKIVKDSNGIAESLINKAKSYINANSIKPTEKKGSLVSWLNKMLVRAKGDDVESMFRRCWALTESLEIYFILRNRFYFGPKKGISFLQQNDKKGYELFDEVLKNMNYANFEAWINYVLTTYSE